MFHCAKDMPFFGGPERDNKVLFFYDILFFFMRVFLTPSRAVLPVITTPTAWSFGLVGFGSLRALRGIFSMKEAIVQHFHKELCVSSGYAVALLVHDPRSKKLFSGIISMAPPHNSFLCVRLVSSP